MSTINTFIEFNLKLKQYKLQFLSLFLFWLMGFLFFLFTVPNQTLWNLLLLSLTVRSPAVASDFAGFYSLILPIFLEVIVFGFIMGELMEKYNPIITSRILAKHKRNHTVIVGMSHLNARVIDRCIEDKKQFVVIEDDEEAVEDLISNGFSVVVGDATDLLNLEDANIKKAKEIFICISEVRVAIICAENIRKLNKDCPIYARVFEEHVQKYLKQPPLNVFAFSTSAATMEGIHSWIENKTGKAIVIGRDHLAHRITYSISLQQGREVFLFDDEHDGIEFVENDRLHIINEFACFLSDLRPHVNLNEVTQAFICWKRESEFDEALYLTSKLNLRYPNIEVYVRVFDDELVNLVKKYNAKTFSSSLNTYKFLQKNVSEDSAIVPKK
jgi:hypothetical protein